MTRSRKNHAPTPAVEEACGSSGSMVRDAARAGEATAPDAQRATAATATAHRRVERRSGLTPYKYDRRRYSSASLRRRRPLALPAGDRLAELQLGYLRAALDVELLRALHQLLLGMPLDVHAAGGGPGARA